MGQFSFAGGGSVTGTTYVNAAQAPFNGDIQAAINSITAGTVYVPAGTYTLSTQLTLPRRISLKGDGRQATIIRWTSSLGADVWGVSPSSGDTEYYVNTISGISFRGPAYGATLTRGTAATDMHGVKIGRRTLFTDGEIGGFHSGLGINADHCWASYSSINGNHYNLRFLPALNRWGDNGLSKVDLNYCSMASVAFDENGSCQGSVFENSHFAGGPYAFYAIPGRTTPSAMINGLICVSCSFEWIGNGLIYAPNSNDDIFDLVFLRSSSSMLADSRIPATTFDYFIYAHNMTRMAFDSSSMFPTTPNYPAVAMIGSSSGGSLTALDVKVQTNLGNMPSSCPFYLHPSGNGAILSNWSNNEATKGRFMKAGASPIPAGTMLRRTGRDSVDIYTSDTDSQAFAGFAQDHALASGVFRTVEEGYTNAAVADGVISAGNYVKPAATDGRVVAATGKNDGAVARALTSATVGQTLQLDVLH